MRSIPLAMTWELLRRGRWWLIVGFVVANALPMMIFGNLQHQRALMPHDRSFVIINFMMMQINMFIFGVAIFAVQAHPSRLYSMPVRTSTIVAWHLFPAMAVMALESIVSTAAANATFGLGWPIWGPAVFLSVMLAAVNAMLWLTEKTAWIVFGITVVAAVLGCWFKSRFGPVFSQPTRLWIEVTLGEAATMLGFAITAYAVAVLAVARNRRGDPLPVLGIVAWIERLFDSSPETRRPFRTPAEAQYWCEWRRKGWVMPGTVGLVIVGGFCLWLIFNRDLRDLFGGLIAGGGILSMAGFIGGVVIGNVGPNDKDYKMGQFLATRPITNRDLARVILKTAVKSTLIAWATWTVWFWFVGASLGVRFFQQHPSFAHLEAWYFPVTLLGPWIVVAVTMSVGLTGRTRPVLLLGGIFVAWGGALLVAAAFTFNEKIGSLFLLSFFATIGAGLIVSSIWAFIAAWRRSLIRWPTMIVGLIGWVALCGLAMWTGMLKPQAETIFNLLLVFPVGLFALAVAPLAAVPLALTWNRTR
jgi:hypothetical protein